MRQKVVSAEKGSENCPHSVEPIWSPAFSRFAARVPSKYQLLAQQNGGVQAVSFPLTDRTSFVEWFTMTLLSRRSWPVFLLTLVCATALTPTTCAQPNKPGVQIQQLDGKLRITIDGELFAEYLYRNISRPILFPVIGPGEAAMTRNWPIQPGDPNESHDHPHHKSLWYGHGDINGLDFWSEEKGAGKTVHEKFLEIRSGAKEGHFTSRNRLETQEGKTIGTDQTTWRVHSRPNERLLDFDITFFASNGPLVFGDTKEGSMAIRLAATLQLKGKVGQGHIVTSEGIRDDKTWGTRAKWCDYYGPVNGQTVGVAIFDHPQNPRHPTWWHVRDYGLFAANPFGVHHFENKAKGAGNLTVPAGKRITFRYRFYFHKGNEQQADVDGHYQEYVTETKHESKNP